MRAALALLEEARWCSVIRSANVVLQ